MTIYESQDYKKFLNSALDSPRFGRGVRTRLAEFLGVQTSFISLVLAGDHDFSGEHGIKIAEFLGLNTEETRFFVLLINHDRAGSVKLKQHYQEELAAIRREKNEIKSRVKSDAKKVHSDDINEYYSRWQHTAVHMAIRVDDWKGDAPAIARALKIDEMDVRSSLQFLEKVGFIRKEKGKYVSAEQRFHFGEKSAALRAHHTNWRVAAIRALDSRREGDLHYSSVMSIDRACADQIRRILLESIERTEPFVKAAKDQEIYAVNLDLFKVSR